MQSVTRAAPGNPGLRPPPEHCAGSRPRTAAATAEIDRISRAWRGRRAWPGRANRPVGTLGGLDARLNLASAPRGSVGHENRAEAAPRRAAAVRAIRVLRPGHRPLGCVRASVKRLTGLGWPAILRTRRTDPWCSGPTCQPVTLEIAGSNPVGSATSSNASDAPFARPNGASPRPTSGRRSRRAGHHGSPTRTRRAHPLAHC
ncbi:MAG: hypothetical protein HW391_284 [Chloroflexi bacterium]|nr:hypothetical protein [Chloroflexota bacterium]